MTIDYVHDVQKIYRKIVTALSFPGSIQNIDEGAGAVDTLFPAGNRSVVPEAEEALIMSLLCMLDRETGFAICTPDSAIFETLEKQISHYTFGKAISTSQADFVICTNDASAMKEAFGSARIGDLINPHLGASIFLMVNKIIAGGNLELRGPGIAETTHITIDAEPDWVELRQEANREYPLGVDVFFIDSKKQLLALPRTTQIRRP